MFVQDGFLYLIVPRHKLTVEELMLLCSKCYHMGKMLPTGASIIIKS
jgi:hypothetical protein